MRFNSLIISLLSLFICCYTTNGIDSVNSEILLSIKKDGKFGIIDTKGKILVKPIYEDANRYSYEGLIAVQYQDKWGFANKKGIVIQCQYDYVYPFKDGYAVVEINEKCGFIDITGKKLTSIHFEQAQAFSEGLAGVKMNGKYGFIDMKGKLIIDYQFDGDYRSFDDTYATYGYGFSEGLIWVKKNDTIGYINKKGELVIDYLYDYASNFKNGYSIVTKRNKNVHGEYGYIDKTGNELCFSKYSYISNFNSNGIAVAAIKDENGNEKWGYINNMGEVVIDFIFPPVSNFTDGVAVVTDINKCGLINEKGEFILPFTDKFYQIENFHEGLCEVVIKDKKRGYIDTSGKLVIPAIFDFTSYFKNGVASVLFENDFIDERENWSWINKKGEFIWKP